MQRFWKIAIMAAVIALVVGSALMVRHLSTPRVIGRSVTPEGIELCVIQKWSGEPFNTSFVFRKPGGQWSWFYYDHEDWYWGHARIALDTNSGIARVFRGDIAAITFQWRTETYTMQRRPGAVKGAQFTMPPGWEPGMD